MPYDPLSLPMGTALGGNEECVDCAGIVADVSFDPCNADRALDADDVLFGFLKCDAEFTYDDGAGRVPVDATQPNPNDAIAFTELVTSGELVLRDTQNFDKPFAEPITNALSSYKPEDTVKYNQAFTWNDSRRLADGSEAQLTSQLLAWSNAQILQCLYVTKNDDCWIYRATTKYNAGHGQSPGQESVELYQHNVNVIIPQNNIVVPFRIAGLYNALKAVSL